MYEVPHSYWKRILKAMAERNQSVLSEQAYRTLLDALESKVDAHVLRKLAIDTAAVLGLQQHDRGTQRPFEGATFDHVCNGPSFAPTIPTLAGQAGTQFAPQKNASQLKPRRRPAPPRP